MLAPRSRRGFSRPEIGLTQRPNRALSKDLSRFGQMVGVLTQYPQKEIVMGLFTKNIETLDDAFVHVLQTIY